MFLTFTSFLAVFMASLAIADEWSLKRPEPNLAFIEHQSLKIGIDQSMGGSITHLSWAPTSKNVINSYDPGRLIQQSYYAGKRLNRQQEGQHKAWSPWTWNPIQGGGVQSWSRLTFFRKDERRRVLYTETIPKLWDMPNEEAQALMKQWTSFETGMPGVVVVKCELHCQRKIGDRWASACPNHQELPATYFTRNFDTFKTYQGAGQWETVTQKIGPPWGQTQSPRKAMACFNENNQGVAIFSPNSIFWNFGPCGPREPSSPTAASCVHLAPVGILSLGEQSTVSYRYWLIVGTQEKITRRLDELWKRYRAEKILITDQ